MLVDDSGAEDGPHHRDEFGHEGGNLWVKAGYGGHPVFLRIVRQQGDEIWSEDGGGKVWHYRMAGFDY